jgi:TPR repeat protein
MMGFLFRLVRGNGGCRQSRSLLRQWQRSGSAVCLAIAIAFAAGIAFAGAACADTDAGIAYLKEGYYIKALAELIPAAEAGDVRAQTNLGSIYYYGEGIAANFDKAFRWYHAAALQGDADAQIGLAIMYIHGQGVAGDLAIAHMWLTLALDKLPPGYDHDRVSVNRDYIGAQLSSSQLVESSNLVQHWYQNHQAP